MELTVLLPFKWISLFNLYLLIIILSCHTTLLLVNGQSQQVTTNQCSNKHTCRDCIQTQSCGWCSLPDFGDKRCLLATSDAAKRCKGKYFYFPVNEYIIFPPKSLTGNTRHVGGGSHMMSSSSSSSSFSSSSSSSSSIDTSSAHHQEVVQITPQNVHLKLRLNEEQKITFFYQQAEDYPVDLYYLMDLSQSMNDDKDSLSKLGNELARNMMDLTSDFRLGFGSFVDKVVMPYVSTVPKNLEEPCTGCAAPYGFKNVMPLSKDTGRFSGEVQKAPVSGNLDAPEGGFDAIMQAVVCRNQIGWRDKARRLLVFSTDAVFHYAGDGKLGGIIKPNDGECHLDPIYNNYTLSNYQDYPSISQINLKVKQNAINVIFAVTSDEIDVYRKLSQHIEGSYFGELTNDSSNVVELVREQYKKITSAVEMKDTANKYLKVTYHSNCLNMSDPLRPVSKCDGLKLGDKVQFEARIELKQCPKSPEEWNQLFKIYPVGINETLTVNVSMLCDCPCEHPGDTDLYEEHSLKCNSFGTYKCGLCECEPSHFGRKCECDANNIKTVIGENLSASCRPDNTSTVDCSGRGQCICGQCECETRANPDEQIYGPYCECDNFSCDRHLGLLCSGPDHGTCVCGKCECKDGWTGDACNCWSRTDTCIAPGSTEVCSGHGTCVCGKCECNDDEKGTHYSGHYCETCRTCPGKCKELKDCVMCRAYKQYDKISEEDCKTNCSWFELELVDQVKLDEEIHENICYEEDENNCRFEFVYKYNNQGKIVVEAMKEPQCPPQVFVLGIVLGVIGAIVLIGLALLLIWKMLTTIQDRREFAKFEKQRAMAKWNTDENPIYKQATSTFKNPTYAGKMN